MKALLAICPICLLCLLLTACSTTEFSYELPDGTKIAGSHKRYGDREMNGLTIGWTPGAGVFVHVDKAASEVDAMNNMTGTLQNLSALLAQPK